jgi:hypothetical protein
MILMLTMAGRYQRFTDEGYKVPKYLLPWKSHTVLWEILNQFDISLQYGPAEHFSNAYLIGNQRDQDFMPHVRDIMSEFGIMDNNLILLSDTSGQAESAYKGMENLPSNAPILIHNVDTVLYNRDLSKIEEHLKHALGYIDVFEAHNRDYSFVLVNENREVTDLAEKVVVSDLATSGLYGFQSVDLYRRYYEKFPCTYISAIYKNILMDEGLVVVGEKHLESDTIVLGTPAEYISASSRL